MGKKKVIIVLFNDDEAGGYSVVMPAFPYGSTMGNTIEHAFAIAKECLELTFQGPSD